MIATTRAVMSMLDVVEEVVLGLAAGQQPDQAWADQVKETFDEHRAEIQQEEAAWEEHRHAAEEIKQREDLAAEDPFTPKMIGEE